MDESKRVEDFLKTEGFPLEMLVAYEFKMAGFEVYQSALYTDQETGKSRELDVTAYYLQHLDLHQSIQIKLIIECKHAKTPWILFAGENRGFETMDSQYFYCCNPAGKRLLMSLSQDLDEVLLGSTSFKIHKCIGYGITEVNSKPNNKDEVKNSYKALMTLIDALRFEQIVEDKKEKQDRNIIEYTIYVPIIVIEGSLYKAEHVGSDKIHISKIDEGQLLYKTNVYEGVFPLIEISTKEKIKELAMKIYSDCEKLTGLFKKEFPG